VLAVVWAENANPTRACITALKDGSETLDLRP